MTAEPLVVRDDLTRRKVPNRWSRRRINLDRVFWTTVRPDEATGCWLWTGGKQAGPRRYGLLTRFGRRWLAHRLAWTMVNGPIADGLYVCHHCDTPLCVRPDHLFLGTAADNAADMSAKGRGSGPGYSGEQHHQAKLTWAEVAAIRDSYSFRRVTYKMLAAKYGVDKSTVRRIVIGDLWR